MTEQQANGIDRAEALRRLRELVETDDPETAHMDADEVLLALIADPEIREAFRDVPKWYA